MMSGQGESGEDIVPSTYQQSLKPKTKVIEEDKTPQQPTSSTPKTVEPIVIAPTTSATEPSQDEDSEKKDPSYVPQGQKRKKDVESVKDYKCDVCNLKCLTRSHLAYHKITHSIPSTEFKCHICNENFLRANLLNMHMAKKHGEAKPRKRQKHSIS